jgi:hypothetical protein
MEQKNKERKNKGSHQEESLQKALLASFPGMRAAAVGTPRVRFGSNGTGREGGTETEGRKGEELTF